ncbi:MAG: hypothetical protein ACRDAX_08120 [Propionibacteriaceae bacterium]
MPDTLLLYAASEADIIDAFGISLRQPQAGQAILEHMIAVNSDRNVATNIGIDVVGNCIMHYPQLALPDHELALPRAIEALVAVASYHHVAPHSCQSVRDLDTIFTEAEIPTQQRPLELSRAPKLQLTENYDADIRVIAHEDALLLCRSWLAAEASDHSELTDFATNFLSCDATTAALSRNPVDLWLFSPGTAPTSPRLDPAIWPPLTGPDFGDIGPELQRYIANITP